MQEAIESRPYLSVIIPAFNESARAATTLREIGKYLSGWGKSFEIIPVDDGSADDTEDVIREYARDEASVRMVHYENNHGKGFAVRQGVYASRGEYVMFSDADNSTSIEELPKLFEAMDKGYDVAIGSRAVEGAVLEIHQPKYRELAGKLANRLIQAVAVPGINDTQCGFKLFRGDVAREIFSKCFIDGWGFDVEVLYLARKMGYSIAEMPVRWRHAEGSKMTSKGALRVFYDLVRIRTHNYAL